MNTPTSRVQVPLPTNAAQVPGPVPGNVMTDSYVQMVGRMAYIWGYAIVNAHNRRAAFAEAPMAGLIGGVIPVAPVGYNAMLTDYIKPNQNFIVCPNQDVTYGAGFFALDKEPTVFQVPEFGDRFYVYAIYDARTDEVARIGKQYGTAPGFYMIVGPNWKGEAPAGITAVIHSSTELASCIPRIFKDATVEDTDAVQPLLSQIMFYPLRDFNGEMKTTDWSKLPHFPAPAGDGGEVKWVEPEHYFDQLPTVMALVPPLPGEEALYAWIRSVWEAAANDSKAKQALTASFVAADNDIVASLFHFLYNGKPIGNGWTAPANASQWGTDYLNRTAVAKSSMFQNTPAETQYQFKESDSLGQTFDGRNLYAITFPKGELPPVKGFWSLTVYNEQHFFTPNSLDRYSLGTKNKTLQYDADGSLTLYLGATSPGTDKETNWIPAPSGTFSLLLRHYWPEQAVIDGTWVPADVPKIK